MKPGTALRLCMVAVFVGLLCWSVGPTALGRAGAVEQTPAPQNSCSFPLPNPSGMELTKYRTLLYNFLDQGCYLNWASDQEIRNTGPVVWDSRTNQINNYGTHMAVKVFYSPEVWKWMKEKKRQGETPDGSMIVKEMYPPPATEGSKLSAWTVMVKDKRGAWDGWFWDSLGVGSPPDPKQPVLSFESGFGTYCIRCHASAAGESTFSDVRNVEGEPIIYRVYVPSMTPEAAPTRVPGIHERIRTLFKAHLTPTVVPMAPLYPPDIIFPNQQFYDHVVSSGNGPEQFLTSDQCLGCHSASPNDMAYFFKPPSNPSQPIPKPINLSPYTEWQASMMGLAGRDPVFHSQVESERAQFPDKSDFLDDKCFSCHGVMGQRQLHLDQGRDFQHEMVYSTPGGPLSQYAKYGALARDGVSCAVCHHIAKEGLGTLDSFTGNFKVDPARTLNGPYTDVTELPMKNALGITPRYADQIKSSALCGSCHVVITPTFDAQGKEIGKFYEQTTYLEWLNSNFQNEYDVSKRPVIQSDVKTCQDCHMPKTYNSRQLTYRIANVQDVTYPFSDTLAPYKDITIKVRDSYSRHTLVALNVFVNAMFQQFSSNPLIAGLPNILGIVMGDYMYDAGELGLKTTQNSMVEMARNETAELEITSVKKTTDALEAEIKITNLAGHSFPSGVEFRRGFVEFQVLDAGGNALWASGRTNAKGEIVNGLTDTVLPTEFFAVDQRTGKQQFQPHFFGSEFPITRQDQVQIYEELVADSDGKITTSFVRLQDHVKDNRLLPRGWKLDGPYAEHTKPFGRAEQDPGYINKTNTKGSAATNTMLYRIPLADVKGQPVSVKATLYYQTIPPYYLADRFSILNKRLPNDKTRETRRLKFLVDNLKVDEPMKDWKLRLVGSERRLGG